MKTSYENCGFGNYSAKSKEGNAVSSFSTESMEKLEFQLSKTKFRVEDLILFIRRTASASTLGEWKKGKRKAKREVERMHMSFCE